LAASRIYNTEWKPYFSAISRSHWYTVQGQPLIYFYNGGTLKPKEGISAVISRMKALFEKDFGVTPFVVMDRGYESPSAGDAQFKWYTLDQPGRMSRYETSTGLKFSNFMVKWDSTGRSYPGQIYSPDLRADRPNHKGPEILKELLAQSLDSQIAFIATWNDLGEGTGINYNYDYYYQDRWLEPDYFMKIIRESQCQ
jgi:hypothetical protein